MMAVDALGSVMAPAARAPPCVAVAVDGATLDGTSLDGGGHHRFA